VERASDELRQSLRSVRLHDRLRVRPERGFIVELLERLPPEVRAGHLPDEEHERRRVLEGGEDPRRRMGGSRRARDETDPRPSRQLAVGLRHVRRAGLVARDHESDRSVSQRVEHRDVALARNAKDCVGAVDDELVDDDPPPAAH
jgi:hypothetical protein